MSYKGVTYLFRKPKAILKKRSNQNWKSFIYSVFVLFVLFDWAPEVPVMSVPVVGFSFKPKGLALVTPLFHLSGYGEGDL